MAAIGEESMELEAMRKDDRSWHPCSISLSANRPATLAVEIHSKNFTEEYTIAGKNEVQSYLRYRSIPLQDGECANVEEGDQVLAMNKDKNKHLFLDAVVEKIRRVKHSKRVYCRCTFEVKWLHSESQLEETVLTSNLVMKLSKKSIDSHPVVAEFLNTVNSTQSTSDVSFFEENTPEIDILGVPEFDLQGLLEKQIEEISRFVDSSKENCVEEITVGWSKVPNGDTTTTKVNRRTLRSSTEEQKKKEPELEAKKKIEDSSFLTPLAARAALASLIHELPNSIKFSDHAGKEEAFANIPSSRNNKAATLSTDHSFQDFGAGRDTCVSESKSSAIHRQNLSRSLYQSEHKGAPDTKKSTTRLTRSTAQKRNPDTKNKTVGEFLDVGKKDNMRLTRSMIEKGSQDQAEEIQKRCHDKKKGAEMLTDELLTTKLVEKKDELFSVAPVKRETRNNQAQKVLERHSQVVPGNSEMESKQATASTFDGNIITKKGTKRTRLANAHENSIVNKEETAVDDKSPQNPKQNESCRKPGSRFSPRLRLLQSNGSGQ